MNKVEFPTCKVIYDIGWDAYWLMHGNRRFRLPGSTTTAINGLLDGRPLDQIPEHETRDLVIDERS